jgi:hypothetical protein
VTKALLMFIPQNPNQGRCTGVARARFCRQRQCNIVTAEKHRCYQNFARHDSIEQHVQMTRLCLTGIDLQIIVENTSLEGK